MSLEVFVQVHAYNPQTKARYILDVVHENEGSDYAILESGAASTRKVFNHLFNIV